MHWLAHAPLVHTSKKHQRGADSACSCPCAPHALASRPPRGQQLQGGESDGRARLVLALEHERAAGSHAERIRGSDAGGEARARRRRVQERPRRQARQRRQADHHSRLRATCWSGASGTTFCFQVTMAAQQVAILRNLLLCHCLYSDSIAGRRCVLAAAGIAAWCGTRSSVRRSCCQQWLTLGQSCLDAGGGPARLRGRQAGPKVQPITQRLVERVRPLAQLGHRR